MEIGDGADRIRQVLTTASMVAQASPVLEAGDRMLDAYVSGAVSSPGVVANDPIAVEARGSELGHAAIATIGEHATMKSTLRLDLRATVMHRIVAIAKGRRRRP